MTPTTGRTIRLGIVDASRIYVEALAARLGAEPDIHVLCCGGDASSLHRMLAQPALDVVLGDATLFDPSSSIDAGRTSPPLRARTGTVPTLVLVADRAECDALVPAVRAGVRGWVPRGAAVDDLLAAIRAAAGGGAWLPPRALRAVLEALVWSSSPQDPVEALLATLTPREREVLLCLAEGLGRQAVAERLRMSTNTVRTHVQSILAKLDVSSSLAAVALVRGACRENTRPSRHDVIVAAP